MNLPKLQREWLTIAEAAEVLSESVFQTHNSSDIYRYALDGRLKLSVDLPLVEAKPGPTVEWDEETKQLFLCENAWRGHGSMANTFAVGDYFVDTADEHHVIEGLWDVWLVGTSRTCVEGYWQMLTGRPFSCTQFFNWGTHVGGLVIVHEPNSAEYQRLYGSHAGRLFPLIEFPPQSQYGIRTEALGELIDQLSEPHRANVQGSRERLQEREILRCLVSLGYEPQSLAEKGPKRHVRSELGSRQDLFQSRRVFDKAWQRLRDSGDVANER